MKNKFTREQIESAEVTLNYFLETFGPVKTVEHIKQSRKYKELFLKLLYDKYNTYNI